MAATSGTLEQLSGSDVVIKTSDGKSVTITTSPSTNIGREARGSLDDISNGTKVFVTGTESNGTVAAATVGVGAVGNLKPLPLPFAKSPGGPKVGLLIGGTAADTNTGGFTVVESDGTNVPVTTSSSTDVITLTNTYVSQLQVGEFTVAVGTAGRGGTLEAARVEQDAIPTSSPPQSKQTPPDGQGVGYASGCSPSTVALDALLFTQ